jgi:hypothetical protein
MQDNPVPQRDWREVPRSEMFSNVLAAVAAARGEAMEKGDEQFVRYVEEQLFPFLEAEQERAREDDRGRETEANDAYRYAATEEDWRREHDVMD